jgi:hypothetical protein
MYWLDQLSLHVNEVLQFLDGEPLPGAVNHSVAVRADQGQVGQLGVGLPGDVQGGSVVTFDVFKAADAIGEAEVEAAYFTSDRQAAPLGIVQLLAAQLRVALAPEVGAEREAAFAS